MKIYDQHVHSYYSFDSEQSIEGYIEKAISLDLSYVVLTDHFDLNYISSGKDIDFDINAQQKELDLLQVKYPIIKLLKGIEIGYVKSELNRISNILSENHFDLVNYSVHEGGNIDFYYPEQFKEHGIEKTLDLYFETLLEALNANVDFDVFCHFDYGFKTAYLANNALKIEDFEEKIIPIFKKIIELDKTLEINVKVQRFLNDEHTKYILSLYKKLGGKNITISTDAHKIDFFYVGIDHYLSLIKKAGFDHVNYFVNRTRFDFKI